MSEENVIDERTAIGGEEGPSGAFPTNSPMVHEGIKILKQERMEEEQASEIGSTVGPTKAVPRDSPPAAGVEGIQVKQEEAELCGSRRPPIKQRYQHQFKETMRLKMEVRNLRRKVHRM